MVKYGLPALLSGVVALSACSLAPDYQVPATPVAAQYKTPGPWASAQPADQIDRNGWWKMYGDAQLDELETRLLANNTDLRAAYAHYQQAQAFVAQVQSGLYPSISASAVPLRERQSDTAPLRGNGPADYSSYTLGASVKYDLDLWGRVRDSVVAGKDEAQASKADLASVRLSLQVELADSDIQLRGLDQQTALLNDTVVAYTKALQLTQTLHNGGIVSGLDVSRAQTQLSAAKSQLSQNLAQRALLEHAIAVLVGASAAEFSLPQQTAAITLPAIPTGVPSTLLQRRPDVAAAERRVAEANAQIGVARAAYFPDITLGLQGGVQSAAYAGLVSAPNAFWAIGPQLVQYLFDGGYRRARLDAAKAATDEAGERYRGVVLSAFQQVEDNLALLSYLGSALDEQRNAAASAQTTVDLAVRQYKQGTVGYLDVVDAQTAQLEAQRGVLEVQTRQLSADVQLLHALGGGWSSDELASVAATPVLVANSNAQAAN
jgi:NodT family efflux transporter outer membrane factor (OMF) lipoprotein